MTTRLEPDPRFDRCKEAARRWRCSLFVMCLLWLSLVSSQAQDTAVWTGTGGWRIGVVASTSNVFPSSARVSGKRITSDLDRGMAPHVRAPHGDLVDGWDRPLTLGVMMRNARADEWSLSATSSMASFRRINGDFPAYSTVRQSALRLEFTRSGSPFPKEQRPRFGFRYGCALNVGYGTFWYSSNWTGPSSKGQSREWIGSTLIRLQPTVQFGYRSKWLNCGLQVHLNAVSIASGAFNGWYKSQLGLQNEDVRYAEHVDVLAFPDEMVKHGLLFSSLQLYISVPIFSLSSRS